MIYNIPTGIIPNIINRYRRTVVCHILRPGETISKRTPSHSQNGKDYKR